MLILNALIINVLTGIAMGYEQLVKSHIGAFYLSGRWRIDQSKHGKYLSKILFVIVEAGFLISGLVIAAICYTIVPHFVVGYFCVSVGGILSGYIYTTRAARFLINNRIIKKHKIDETNLVKGT